MNHQDHLHLLEEFFQSQDGRSRSRSDFSALSDFSMGKSDEFWIWCLTTGRSQDPRLNGLLPAPVEPTVQERYTGQSGESTFRQALGFKEVCTAQMQKRGGSMTPRSRLLDFGCGWGRISLTFLNRVRPENLFAVDVGDDAISTCLESGLPCDVRKIEPAPPLPFADGSFDVIVSYSVFSHLSKKYFLGWAREFRRILRSGGYAFLTTRPRDAIQWFKDLRDSGDVPFYARGAAQSFVDAEAAFLDYDSGRFCFSPEEVPHIGDYYGEACIPLAFLENHLTGLFQDIDMVLFNEHHLFDQNLIVLRK